MKRTALLFLFLLICPVLSHAAPSIAFDETSFDFGTVSEESVTHYFDFTNAGDQELLIQNVSAP